MSSPATFTILGRRIPRTTLLGILIVALVATNIITLQQSKWIDDQYIDNVALTQNAFQNLLNEFHEVLSAETLNEKSIMELEEWVEKTSVQSAKVTFLDRNHFDLWSGTSDRLEQLEAFLEELRTTVRERNTLNNPVTLDEEAALRLQAVYISLEDYYHFVFPVDVLEEGTLWAQPHRKEYDTAFEKMRGFHESLGEAWLIIPVIRGSTASSPETQARELIVEAVGEEYYREYFELWIIEHNTWEPEEWLTGIVYLYHIQVGDYNATREVYFHFDKMNRLIMVEGVPRVGNLMPFTVTRERAIMVASGNITGQYVDVDAEIFYKKKTSDGLSVDRYVWSVEFFRTPREAWSGSGTSVYVDPVTGEVIGLEDYSWAATP